MGRVIPSTLKILQPALEYSLVVAVSADEEYGRLVLVMNKKTFCVDAAGNGFTRSFNSSYKLHYGMHDFFLIFFKKLHKWPYFRFNFT